MERAVVGDVFLDQFEMHGRLLGERQSEIRSRRCEAVLTAEEQGVSSSLEIEIGIAPGVKVGATSESLSWLVGSVFACVMHDSDGKAERARKLTQSGKDGGNLSGVVFVGALESDVGVEHEELRLVLFDGGAKPAEMFCSVEPESGLENQPYVEGIEVRLSCVGELEEPFAELLWSILGPVGEHGTGSRDVEATETRSSRSDGDGEFQSEPSLAALGLSSDDAHGPVPPELVDEPKRRVEGTG